MVAETVAPGIGVLPDRTFPSSTRAVLLVVGVGSGDCGCDGPESCDGGGAGGISEEGLFSWPVAVPREISNARSKGAGLHHQPDCKVGRLGLTFAGAWLTEKRIPRFPEDYRKIGIQFGGQKGSCRQQPRKPETRSFSESRGFEAQPASQKAL